MNEAFPTLNEAFLTTTGIAKEYLGSKFGRVLAVEDKDLYGNFLKDFNISKGEIASVYEIHIQWNNS
jgi:hypothetical protein